jgi:endogenous inhibitor of DNA gyrase (YacG/DUF329 family)
VTDGLLRPRCIVCKRPVQPRPQNEAFPFCSARCKLVDLGKWLSDEYSIPGSDSADVDEDTQEKA